MTWRLANSLIRLRDQIDIKFPGRSKNSDGTIGDLAHSERKSEHNPNDRRVVTAMDITNDPHGGLSSRKLAEYLILKRDPRLWYVISNKEIASYDHENFKWRPYAGVNPHDHHMHISVRQTPDLYDGMGKWDLDGFNWDAKIAAAAKDTSRSVKSLKIGDAGKSVEDLQKSLNSILGLHLIVDGRFGPTTMAAVQTLQQKFGLIDDGIVGPMTWAKIGSQPATKVA
jgi:hypothetical protein